MLNQPVGFTAGTYGFLPAPLAVALPRPFPHTRQTTPDSCGRAVLRSVLAYWGLNLNEAQIIGLIGAAPPSAPVLAQAVRACGLLADIQIGLSVADLAKYVGQGDTIIVPHWYEDSGHYAVVTKITDSHIHIMDPWIAQKERRLTIGEFQRMWYYGTLYCGGAIRVNAEHSPR